MQHESQFPSELSARLRETLVALGLATSPHMLLAPGRINVLGEHTDYSGGFALPAAVDRGILLAFGPGADDRLRLASLEEPGIIELTPEGAPLGDIPAWGRYAAAVVAELALRGIRCPGFVGALGSTIPRGGGLSSSAALCVALTLACAHLAQASLSSVETCWIAQAAEHRVGVQCGILDQYAIVHGRAGSALLLDCGSVTHRSLPFEVPGFTLVVGDTRKARGLVDSEYNARRRQVEEATRLLNGARKAGGTLRDVTRDRVDALREKLGPLLWRRALHVVEENARTQAAAALFEEPALEPELLARRLGQLLDASHQSLRDHFEVSCRELDELVEALRAQGDDAVPGARMMGGGFGGCVLALVAERTLEESLDRAATVYRERTGLDARFFAVHPTCGARLLDPAGR